VCAAAFSDAVVGGGGGAGGRAGRRAPGGQGARARDGAQEKIAALGACTMERTGPCQRERGTGRRSCPHPRASACKDQNAVTSAQIAALRATHLHDGAGARAVAA
jgi:hypothetical protein